MKFDPKQRPLFAALGLSGALHLLLLFGGGFARLQPAANEAVASSLQVIVHAASAPVSAAAPLPRAPAPHVSPGAVPAKAKEPRLALPSPQPALPEPSVAPGVPVANQSASPAAAGEARLAENASSATSAATAVAAAAAAPSAEGLRQYRIDLAGAARRFRNYPALARSRGWEGVVELSVAVLPAGQPTVSLAQSSGFPVLDEQAQDMLARAAAQTPLPESLRGRSFSVALPIRFSLQE